MTESEMYLYVDSGAKEMLGGRSRLVLLVGGYGGYANLGDIAQVKAAVRWHRDTTGLRPLPLLHVGAIEAEDAIDRLRRQLGVEGVLLVDPTCYDLGRLGCKLLRSPPAVEYLHFYGGASLNAFWGKSRLAQIETLVRTFRVRHYVLSGQQVDASVSDELKRHFRDCPPSIAGGRDEQSVRVLAECGAPAEYSFDDACEFLRDMAEAVRDSASGDADALIHLNLSEYATGDDKVEARARLARAVAHVRRHMSEHAGQARPRPVMLEAYTDRHPDIADTLESIKELETAFPFLRYEVVNLAKLALDFGQAPPPAAPLPLKAPLAVVSSYHTAMFCVLLGVPCYLRAGNDFYRQKRRGLGMPEVDLETFLSHPERTDLTPQFRRRLGWLESLADAFRGEGKIAPCAMPAASGPETEPLPWHPKAGVPDVMAHFRQVEQRLHESEAERNTLDAETQRLRAKLEGLESRKLFRLARRLGLFRS